VPDDVKLLPGQLLGIQQTVRDAHPPTLPHRQPLPSFESPYAQIDDCLSEIDAKNTAAAEKPTDTSKANGDTERLTDHSLHSLRSERLKIQTSDVAFPEKYYVINFPEIFHSGKISVAYFCILQYYIQIYILNIFNI